MLFNLLKIVTNTLPTTKPKFFERNICDQINNDILPHLVLLEAANVARWQVDIIYTHNSSFKDIRYTKLHFLVKLKNIHFGVNLSK